MPYISWQELENAVADAGSTSIAGQHVLAEQSETLLKSSIA